MSKVLHSMPTQHHIHTMILALLGVSAVQMRIRFKRL